jgi:hypothetical protein
MPSCQGHFFFIAKLPSVRNGCDAHHISNLGMPGGRYAVPIVSIPAVAILAADRAQ